MNKRINKKNYSSYFLLLVSVFYVYLFFPGLITNDSIDIYKQALAHKYFEHHPPLMALLWHYLNLLYPGPALMLIFNMLLLWGGMFIGTRIFQGKKWLYWFIFLPFYPSIWIYSSKIWKDCIFTFGYGLISLYFSYKTVKQEKISKIALIPLLIGMFYFTAVKYQARFMLPFLILWFFYIQEKKPSKKILLFVKTIALSAVMIFLIDATHSLIVEDVGKSHSWERVKIWDLAGISIDNNEILLPRFLLRSKNITLDDIKAKYVSDNGEPLSVEKDSPARLTKNEEERQSLLAHWRKMVLAHPLSYFKHRFSFWFSELILASPITNYLDSNFSKNKVRMTYIRPVANLFAYVFLLPLQLLYMFMGIKLLFSRHRKYTIPLVFLNLMSIVFLMVMLVFSLAYVPRYIFFSLYLFMLSHPFAYYCYKERKKS